MLIREFRQGLVQLEEVLSSWQAKNAASDLRRLSDCLSKHDDLSVADFCKIIEAAQSSAKKVTPVLSGDDVAELVNELKRAELNEPEFQKALKKVGVLPTAQLASVARMYTGTDLSYGKKADARKAIEKKRELIFGTARRQDLTREIF